MIRYHRSLNHKLCRLGIGSRLFKWPCQHRMRNQSLWVPGGVWSQGWNLKELTEGHHQELTQALLLKVELINSTSDIWFTSNWMLQDPQIARTAKYNPLHWCLVNPGLLAAKTLVCSIVTVQRLNVDRLFISRLKRRGCPLSNQWSIVGKLDKIQLKT